MVGLTALIVDDDDSMREMITTVLSLTPIEVVGEASNGQEAVDQVAALRPSIVLMDLMMPVMDGVEATRRIKKANPDVAIVAFSAGGDEKLEQVLAAGAAGVFAKTQFPELVVGLHAFASPQTLADQGA